MALIIVLVAITVVITGWLDSVLTALPGVATMICFGVMANVETFKVVDWNLIAILLSIWIIAGFLGKSGVRDYLVAVVLKASKGNMSLFVVGVGMLAGFWLPHDAAHDAWWNRIPAFFALFGFIGCLAIIFFAKFLGKFFYARRRTTTMPIETNVPPALILLAGALLLPLAPRSFRSALSLLFPLLALGLIWSMPSGSHFSFRWMDYQLRHGRNKLQPRYLPARPANADLARIVQFRALRRMGILKPVREEHPSKSCKRK